MREQEALELIDAHLDDDVLTDQQVAELTAWLKENPQHAKRAFQRIFLHSFLRRRLQARRLSSHVDRTDLVPIDAVELEPATDLLIPQSTEGLFHARKFPWSKRLLLACVIIVSAMAIGWLSRVSSSVPSVAMPDAYDGFAYPATSASEPTSETPPLPMGGLQGLDGGTGWAEPWQETGLKVASIFDHASEQNWDPKDMRKFSPLGHTDSQGHVLQSTGFQMRTATGPRSLTSRKLDLTTFPKSMMDESGLGVDGTVIWISFLAQSFNSTAENNRFAYFQIGSRQVSGFRIGKVGAAPSGNWVAMGLLTGAQVNLRSSAVPSGEMTFLVTQLEFRAGPEDAAVWINPGLGAEPKLAEATLRLSVPDFRFDGITINANSSTDIDEIRIGRSFRAVAPIK